MYVEQLRYFLENLGRDDFENSLLRASGLYKKMIDFREASVNMDPLITICARSGSQGVKNKNIRPLLGKTAHRALDRLRAAVGGADRVVVSTDWEDRRG